MFFEILVKQVGCYGDVIGDRIFPSWTTVENGPSIEELLQSVKLCRDYVSKLGGLREGYRVSNGNKIKVAHGWALAKRNPPDNLPDIAYNDETWFSYTLRKEASKTIFTRNQLLLLYQEIRI